MSPAPLELLASTIKLLGPNFPLVGQLARKHKMLIGSAAQTISDISFLYIRRGM